MKLIRWLFLLMLLKQWKKIQLLKKTLKMAKLLTGPCECTAKVRLPPKVEFSQSIARRYESSCQYLRTGLYDR